MRRRPARDFLAVAWFLAAAGVALIHRWIPESTWLMIHLVMLGAVSHSILVWSAHFTRALLKSREDHATERRETIRLVAFAIGAALVFIGVPTAFWVLTLAGAAITSAIVVWHAIVLIGQLRRALPGRFRITIRYYLAAAAALPVGAGLGVLLARGLPEQWHARALVAHSMTMLLAWVEFTVVGTLITFWPTVLRTRMDDRGERLARQALPILSGGATVVIAGALSGLTPVAALGMLGYGFGLAWVGRSLIGPLRHKPPQEFAGMSLLVAMCWFAIAVVVTAVALLTRSGQELVAVYSTLAGIWVVGFAVQLVTGALSYLLPSVIGGGATAVKQASRWFNFAAPARIVIINGGLILLLLPLQSWVRVGLAALVLIALIAFPVLLVAGTRSAVRVKRRLAAGEKVEPRPAGAVFTPSGWIAGAVALALVAAIGAAVGTGTSPSANPAAVPTSGRTVEVHVEAHDMRFVPDQVEVNRGDRLVITLTNRDPTTVHDLRLGDQQTPRLSPGSQAQLVIEVVGESIEGWCTIVGHRQMGMVFTVFVAGDDPPDTEASPHSHETPHPHETLHSIVDPVAPPASTGDSAVVHRVELRVREVPLEVAPGVWQQRWTFNGASVAPTLRGAVGDRFEITVINDGSMGHSIDFHAGAIAPDVPMRTIPPGESLRYVFVAQRSGIWMYHCATEPMSAHIAAGMAGAVIIDPPGLPAVDQEYVITQSEIYLSSPGHRREAAGEVDASAAMTAGPPSLMTFNGIADQYLQHPLRASVGDRIRIWLLDIGPNRPLSFHIVGAQFDTIYREGGYLLRRGVDPFGTEEGGAQALALQPAEGGFVEFVITEAGHYTLVNHVMADAGRGARGTLQVTE